MTSQFSFRIGSGFHAAIIKRNKQTQLIYNELMVLKDRIAEELSGLYGNLPEISLERKLCALKALPSYRRIILKGIVPWKRGVFLEEKERVFDGWTQVLKTQVLKKSSFNDTGEIIKTLKGYHQLLHLEMFDLETFSRLTELSDYYDIKSIRSGEFLHQNQQESDTWYDLRYIHRSQNVATNFPPE